MNIELEERKRVCGVLEREATEREEEGRLKRERMRGQKEEMERLQGELERVRSEGEERLAGEGERWAHKEERERRRQEDERQRWSEEREREVARVREEQETAALRVREEEERVRRGLEAQALSLQGKVRVLEEGLAQGKEYRLVAAQGRLTTLQQEVDSLKSVVEMRTAEIHQLRAERVRLEEKLEHYDQTQLSMKKLSSQVEDLKEQLGARTEAEFALQEENRRLHTLVMRESCEKKRLSMENEQLSWKMQEGLDCSGQGQETAMSMSYCEGTAYSMPHISSPRFSRGLRPLSAPPGQDPNLIGSSPLPPDSPRVLEVVEKEESVSWKLEYGEGELFSSSLSSSPATKRKLSPQSPLALRRVVSSGLMTRSLDMSSLHRSHSYTAGTSNQIVHNLMNRSGSIRKKILPVFEPLSESTESDSDESKKNSPTETTGKRLEEKPLSEEQEEGRSLQTPAPVDIVGGEEYEEGEISSSSEIEVGESSRCSEVDQFMERIEGEEFAPSLHRCCR